MFLADKKCNFLILKKKIFKNIIKINKQKNKNVKKTISKYNIQLRQIQHPLRPILNPVKTNTISL